MVGVLTPEHRDVVGLGGQLEAAVGPPEPVGQQLLTPDVHVGEPGVPGEARQLTRPEGMHVDELLEVVIGLVARIFAAGARTDEPAPQGRRQGGAELRHAGDPVAMARGLAGEHDDASGAQHAVKVGERPRQVREVVQYGVAEDEVEALVGEGQPAGLTADRADLEPEPLRVGAQRGQHAGGDIGADGLVDDPGLQQVQREVAGAGADLQ